MFVTDVTLEYILSYRKYIWFEPNVFLRKSYFFNVTFVTNFTNHLILNSLPIGPDFITLHLIRPYEGYEGWNSIFTNKYIWFEPNVFPIRKLHIYPSYPSYASISYTEINISYIFHGLIFDFSNQVFIFVVSSRWYFCLGRSEGWNVILKTLLYL